jgi:hypothetical protein
MKIAVPALILVVTAFSLSSIACPAIRCTTIDRAKDMLVRGQAINYTNVSAGCSVTVTVVSIMHPFL